MDIIVKKLSIGVLVADFLLNTSRVLQAIELYKESLIVVNNIPFEHSQDIINLCYNRLYQTMVHAYGCIYDHINAMECCKNLLVISRRCGDRSGEAAVTQRLAIIYSHQGNHTEAKNLCKKALSIMIEIGDRQGEGACYGVLGAIFQPLGEYGKAKEYLQKALTISKEIENREGEATEYGNLGAVFESLGEHVKAEEHFKKSLKIRREIGDRQGEGTCYLNLASVFNFYGDFAKAEEYLQKAVQISKETGDRRTEGSCYEHLGTMFHKHLDEYAKAKAYLKKAVAISKGTGSREREAKSYISLGILFESVCEYSKAHEYLQKALAIGKEIGARKIEAECYGNLGVVFTSRGEYDKAKEYLQKALKMEKEIGNRKREGTHYEKLGVLFRSIGEYGEAEKYFHKALAILKEVGDRKHETSCYANLGAVYFEHFDDHGKAEKYLHTALAMAKEFGNRKVEAFCYSHLGYVFWSLSDYDKAEEYLQKALEIRKEIGDKQGQAMDYGNLGTVSRCRCKYGRAREYHEKAITITKETGDIRNELTAHANFAMIMLLEGNIIGAFSSLFESIQKCEYLRTYLRGNDQFKVSFLDGQNASLYQILSHLFCSVGKLSEALCVVELGRARALADLMSAQYSVEKEISFDPQSWVGIEKVMKKESDCTCLYISYVDNCVFLNLWILKANKPILLRQTNVNDSLNNKGLVIRSVDEIFSNETFRTLPFVTQEHCEDRSLFSNHSTHLKSSLGDGNATVRIVEEEEDEDQRPDPTLAGCYQMLISPVAHLLDEPEILIVPDRHLSKVPFPALKDETGKYLSENFRIRIIPSLTILKLIQDCPADYHKQTGVLIVGEPKVDQVYYRGRIENLCPLPAARKEAEMIGRLLRAQPLLGQQATKQAVLHSIHSVALIHFAAHGNAERGEIALAPQLPNNGIPQEDDYLLTMADISKVQLRAKLVVLSCCHSARGPIRSEGVVGIARAFLGSGARSVLAALWALEDKATEHFMSRFYEHLVCGESVSESLHQAMKWMRQNGFSDVGQWAPFMLIGDNVTFTLGK